MELSDFTAPSGHDLAIGQSTVVKVRCPTLRVYPPEHQRATAAELRAAGARVQELVADYIALRDACRALAVDNP